MAEIHTGLELKSITCITGSVFNLFIIATLLCYLPTMSHLYVLFLPYLFASYVSNFIILLVNYIPHLYASFLLFDPGNKSHFYHVSCLLVCLICIIWRFNDHFSSLVTHAQMFYSALPLTLLELCYVLCMCVYFCIL